MKIIEIGIRNFLSIGQIDFSLDSPGLNLVLGSNKDSEQFDSNGAAKSAMFEAMIWGLFGEVFRGISIDDVVRKGTKEMEVILTLDPEDGNPLVTIQRARFNKKSAVNIFTTTTMVPMFPSSTYNTIQTDINEWLGIDYRTFVNSIYFGKGLSKFFMVASDDERKELLETVLQIVSFEDAQERAKAEYRVIEEKKAVAASAINVTNALLNTATTEKEVAAADFSKVKECYAQEVEQFTNKIAELAGTCDTLKPLIKEVREQLATLDTQYKEELHRIEMAQYAALNTMEPHKSHALKVIFDDESRRKKEIAVTKKELLAELQPKEEELKALALTFNTDTVLLSDEIGTKSGEVKQLTANGHSLDSVYKQRKCSTCQQPISDKHVSAVKADIASKVSELKAEIAVLQEEKRELAEQYNHAKEQLSFYIDTTKSNIETAAETLLATLDADIRRTTTLTYQDYSKQEADIVTLYKDTVIEIKDRYNEETSALKVNEATFIGKFNTVNAERKAAVDDLALLHKTFGDKKKAFDELDSKIGVLSEKLAKLTKEHSSYGGVLDTLAFWVEAFGPKGIKSFIFESSLPYLTDRANHYSSFLTGGTVRIKILPSSVTKTTGNVKEKIFVSAVNQYGAEVYIGNSDGERRRIDLCILLALQDLISSRATKTWNIMIFDEVMDSLDEIGIQSLLDLFRSIASDHSIFIISHSDSIRQHFFDKVITIVKENGVSYLLT